MKFVKTIVDNEVAYMSIHEKRQEIVAKLRGANVQYQDVESFLLKEARKEGYYTDPSHLVKAREEKKAWIVYLDRYILWIKNTYKAKWELKAKVATDKKDKPTVKSAPSVSKTITEERAEKLLENLENVRVLETALLNRGKKIVNNSDSFLILESPEQAEDLVEDEEYRDWIIIALETMGYEVTKRG